MKIQKKTNIRVMKTVLICGLVLEFLSIFSCFASEKNDYALANTAEILLEIETGKEKVSYNVYRIKSKQGIDLVKSWIRKNDPYIPNNHVGAVMAKGILLFRKKPNLPVEAKESNYILLYGDIGGGKTKLSERQISALFEIFKKYGNVEERKRSLLRGYDLDDSVFGFKREGSEKKVDK